jgi:hypothetical protein
MPTRIDQGAEYIAILEVPNRYRRHHQSRLKTISPTRPIGARCSPIIHSHDLADHRLKLQNLLPDEEGFFIADKVDLYELQYPVLAYPKSKNSLNLENTPHHKGKLIGTKGQY